jgi:arylsulfatase A-like enzyme
MQTTTQMRIQSLLICLAASVHVSSALAEPETPNIVLFYVDDLGWGDVGCYGGTGVATPNVDKLASEGLRFTDAHTTSATCTPSRYALLTGEYPWRKRGTSILPGNAGMIIEPDRGTLPLTLQSAGYSTGAIGKWHLGLGPTSGPDWNQEIKPGAAEVGYHDSFLMAATGDRVPCVYVENGKVKGLDPADPILVDYIQPIPGQPTGKDNPELLHLHPSHGHDMAVVNGISRIGHMKGGTAARWKDEDMADIFVARAQQFIQNNKAKPFFLYLGTQDIHVPRVPNPRFAGKSTMGSRGDAIIQMDWCLGEVVNALSAAGVREKTLLIFTSDNGPVLDDGYKDDAVAKLGNHKPAGPWRGGKYSIFEGGTRVPFIAHWPSRIQPGRSDALLSQIDLHASLAELVGAQLKEPRDSQNHLSALLGKRPTARKHLYTDAGAHALRSGQWKYIRPNPGKAVAENTGAETGNAPRARLFNLFTDPHEEHDLLAEQPELVASLEAEMKKIASQGRVIELKGAERKPLR